VKTIQERFALLLCLEGIFVWFVELLILAMRWHKLMWRDELVVKSLFGGRKNLLPKKNPMVSPDLAIATKVEPGEKDMERAKENFLVAAELGNATDGSSGRIA
jgi:hypothetical protein